MFETVFMAVGIATVWWYYQDFLNWVDRKLTPNGTEGNTHGEN